MTPKKRWLYKFIGHGWLRPVTQHSQGEVSSLSSPALIIQQHMKPARTLLHLNAAQKSPSVIRVRLLTLSLSQCWCQCNGSLSSNKKHQLTLAHSSPQHYETLSGKCRGGQSKRVRMHIPVRLPCNPNAVILLFNLKIVMTEDNIAQLFPSLVSKHYKLCWRPGSWYSNWTPCQGCQIGGGGGDHMVVQ